MYRCTDIPGQFVWQPGTLTQAVSRGHWILLEDIDYAALDVVCFCTLYKLFVNAWNENCAYFLLRFYFMELVIHFPR